MIEGPAIYLQGIWGEHKLEQLSQMSGICEDKGKGDVLHWEPASVLRVERGEHQYKEVKGRGKIRGW